MSLSGPQMEAERLAASVGLSVEEMWQKHDLGAWRGSILERHLSMLLSLYGPEARRSRVTQLK